MEVRLASRAFHIRHWENTINKSFFVHIQCAHRCSYYNAAHCLALKMPVRPVNNIRNIIARLHKRKIPAFINLNLIKFSSRIHTSKQLPHFCSTTDYSASNTLTSSLDTCFNALNLMLIYFDVTLRWQSWHNVLRLLWLWKNSSVALILFSRVSNLYPFCS